MTDIFPGKSVSFQYNTHLIWHLQKGNRQSSLENKSINEKTDKFLRYIFWKHLINGKANGLKFAVKPPLSSSIFLHQPHQKGTPVLPVHWVIVHILQTYHELRVGWECGWKAERCTRLLEVVQQNILARMHKLHPLLPAQLRQPPAVEPILHIPSNWQWFQWCTSLLASVSGVKLQISRLENCLMKSEQDILNIGRCLSAKNIV